MTNANLTRRAVVAGGAAAAVGAGLARPARAQSAAKTFVLVHGAACGGWIWRRVADLLEKQGCKVFAPTFTGLGERSHLLTKDVGLDTHVTDVVNVVAGRASTASASSPIPTPAGRAARRLTRSATRSRRSSGSTRSSRRTAAG